MILDSITSFIMDPSNDNRKPAIQGIAWLTTIILGIGTIGIVHGLSALWRKLRHIDKNETHEKIGRLFHEVFSKNKKDHQSVNERTSFQQVGNLVRIQDAPQIPRTSLTQKKLAYIVYAKSEELWNAAMREAKGDDKLAMTFFITNILNDIGKYS